MAARVTRPDGTPHDAAVKGPEERYREELRTFFLESVFPTKSAKAAVMYVLAEALSET